jgi:hypothetical protein
MINNAGLKFCNFYSFFYFFASFFKDILQFLMINLVFL